MGTARMIGWAVGLLALIPPWTQAQTPAGAHPGPRVILSSPTPASVSSLGAYAQGEIVREIDDSHNGDRWLLVRDPNHPGGPGLLLLVASVRSGPGPGPNNPDETNKAVTGQAATGGVVIPPAIRSGDRVIVEEHTPVVDARLEAVALGPAQVGSPFRVRLGVGGRIVRAVALGPGRAAFAEETGR